MTTTARTGTPELRTTKPSWGWIDPILMAGTALAIVAASIDYEIFDLGAGLDTDTSVLIMQRLAVYVPLALGLLHGIDVSRALSRPPLVVFLLFTLWTVGAAAFSDDVLGEVERAAWFVGFALLAVMVVSRIGWGPALDLAAGIAFLIVGAGVIAYLAGWVRVICEAAPCDGISAAEREFFEEGLFGRPRVRGLAYQANSFGRTASYLLVLGMLMPLRHRGILRLALGTTCVGLAGYALFLSQARFSALSVVAALIVILAGRGLVGRVISATAIVGVAVLTLLVLVTGSLGDFARTEDPDELSSLLGRTEVWDEAVDVVLERPLTGIGTEGLSRRYAELESSAYLGWDPANAHNLAFQAAAAHGLIGASLLLISLLTGLGAAWSSNRLNAVAFIVMFGVQGVSEAILLGNPSIAVFLLVAALMAGRALARSRSDGE